MNRCDPHPARPHLLLGFYPAEPRLPKRPRRMGGPEPACQRPGRVACVALGVSRVRADFGGIFYTGAVAEFRAPWFRVVFTDGDSADYTVPELAPLLDFSGNGFYEAGVLRLLGHPPDVQTRRFAARASRTSRAWASTCPQPGAM